MNKKGLGKGLGAIFGDAADPVKLEDMMNAEEVFLTNTQDGIVPVLSIDGKAEMSRSTVIKSDLPP